MNLREIYSAKIASGDLRVDPAQESALAHFERLIRDLARPAPKSRMFGLMSAPPEPVRGLYIWGGVGRGKSMMMDLFFETVAEPRKRRVHFHAFMQEVHARLHEVRKTGVEDAIKPIGAEIARDTRLLCFDEVQITDITDAMIVGRLFETLFAAGVVVVATSNRAPDDLYENGLNRNLFLPFIDLLKQRLDIYEMRSDSDYRQGRLAGTPTYFYPADERAGKQISDIWTSLTGGLSEPLVLDVKGRQVTLPHFHNGIARARFFDLCGAALGPADYLALADAVKVLILENIPRMSRSNFNEAKRFVTLIDALYEAKTRFICSAADAPESLYLEGEGTFEFERTASRLREMQSADWGGKQL